MPACGGPTHYNECNRTVTSEISKTNKNTRGVHRGTWDVHENAVHPFIEAEPEMEGQRLIATPKAYWYLPERVSKT